MDHHTGDEASASLPLDAEHQQSSVEQRPSSSSRYYSSCSRATSRNPSEQALKQQQQQQQQQSTTFEHYDEELLLFSDLSSSVPCSTNNINNSSSSSWSLSSDGLESRGSRRRPRRGPPSVASTSTASSASPMRIKGSNSNSSHNTSPSSSLSSSGASSSNNNNNNNNNNANHHHRHHHHGHRRQIPSPVHEEDHRSSLRSSLDSGMAAIHRWMMARRQTLNNNSNAHDNTAATRRPSYANSSSGWPERQRRQRHSSFRGWESSSSPLDQYQQSSSSWDFDDHGESWVVRARSSSESAVLLPTSSLSSSSPSNRHHGQRRNHHRTGTNRELLSSSAAAALDDESSSTATNNNNLPPLRSTRQRSFTDGAAGDLGMMELTTTAGMTTTNTAHRAEGSNGGAGGGGTGNSSGNLPHAPSPPSPEHAGNTPATGGHSISSSSSSSSSEDDDDDEDPEQRARIRWVLINRRFQVVITSVAVVFSFLLFFILIGWVYLTTAYVITFDKPCDVSLKRYYWLVTIQLILDVFRSDIVRFLFQYDPNSPERIPCRVVFYNVTYIIYACLVMRLGVLSVFADTDSTCRHTSPELYHASLLFVTVSLAAWVTIIFGYLLPFIVVAALLTWNGYHPSTDGSSDVNAAQPVFPAAYSTTGAPAGCVEQLKAISMEDYPQGFPGECCICMEGFALNDDVIETVCRHQFHKSCCRQWLRQSRTCPVCRDDIPSSLAATTTNTIITDGSVMLSSSGGVGDNGDDSDTESRNTNGNSPSNRIPVGPTGRPVRGLIRMLSTTTNLRASASTENFQEVGNPPHNVVSINAESFPTPSSQVDVEQGTRARRLYSTEF